CAPCRSLPPPPGAAGRWPGRPIAPGRRGGLPRTEVSPCRRALRYETRKSKIFDPAPAFARYNSVNPQFSQLTAVNRLVETSNAADSNPPSARISLRLYSVPPHFAQVNEVILRPCVDGCAAENATGSRCKRKQAKLPRLPHIAHLALVQEYEQGQPDRKPQRDQHMRPAQPAATFQGLADAVGNEQGHQQDEKADGRSKAEENVLRLVGPRVVPIDEQPQDAGSRTDGQHHGDAGEDGAGEEEQEGVCVSGFHLRWLLDPSDA